MYTDTQQKNQLQSKGNNSYIHNANKEQGFGQLYLLCLQGLVISHIVLDAYIDRYIKQ